MSLSKVFQNKHPKMFLLEPSQLNQPLQPFNSLNPCGDTWNKGKALFTILRRLLDFSDHEKENEENYKTGDDSVSLMGNRGGVLLSKS